MCVDVRERQQCGTLSAVCLLTELYSVPTSKSQIEPYSNTALSLVKQQIKRGKTRKKMDLSDP